MPNIKRKLKTGTGQEISYEMRNPTNDELDAYDIAFNSLPGKYSGEELIKEQFKARVNFFDMLHITSSPLKNEIRGRIKSMEIFKLFEVYETVDEKN